MGCWFSWCGWVRDLEQGAFECGAVNEYVYFH